eukprot:scaffold179662_cov32-Prasinocladus_malaysianus.AAC.1
MSLKYCDINKNTAPQHLSEKDHPISPQWMALFSTSMHANTSNYQRSPADPSNPLFVACIYASLDGGFPNPQRYSWWLSSHPNTSAEANSCRLEGEANTCIIPVSLAIA